MCALLPLLGGCGGCRETPPAPARSGTSETGGAWQKERFTYPIDNLFRLEEYESGELYGEIEKRRQAVAQGTLDGRKSPLLTTWVEPEMLRQIVDRLNQWIRSQNPLGDWRRDPLLEELPPLLRELPMLSDLDRLEFSRYDGFALFEAALLRDVSQWARGERLDDLSRAQRLFDWTVRNIQLEPESPGAAGRPAWVPQVPWETLFFGRGTAWERAWVFILLARQQGIPAAVLAIAEEDPSRPPRPWAVGVLVEGKVYLFDPRLGLPIPARDGIHLERTGPLRIVPATLEQVVADAKLLRALDVEPGHAYPVQAGDLNRVVALVEASPAHLSQRMRLVELQLGGQQKMVLTASARQQADLWHKVPHVTGARLWTRPYETLHARLHFDGPGIDNRLRMLMPFYAISGAKMQAPAKTDPQRGAQAEEPREPPSGSLEAAAQEGAPLFRGRLLHLKGRFTGEHTAAIYYLACRPSDEQVRQMIESRGDELYEKRAGALADLPPAERQAAEKRLRGEVSRELAGLVDSWRMGKYTASYWLGLVAREQGNPRSAADYLGTFTLNAVPGGIWDDGAKYNLARLLEAVGQREEAVRLYREDARSPCAHGNLLRARWLSGL